MTTFELKKVLIHKINKINDISFLKASKTILESKTDAEVISLTDEKRNEIITSRKGIEQGLFIENELLDKKVSGWLSAR